MSQKYSGRVTLIVAIVLVALLAIFSPSIAKPRDVAFNRNVPFLEKTNLKPGIDIVGGTSLLYQIKAPEGVRAGNLAEEVMKALKKRIDPNGTLNLIWRPQGADRLEIQMPLTSANGEGAKLQKQMEAARDRLDATNVSVTGVVDALEGKGGRTRAEFDKLVASAPPLRKQMLQDLSAAYDAKVKADEAQDVAASVEARVKFDLAQRKLADTNLTSGELDRVLNLKASRDKRLADLKKQAANYPERLAAIDNYLAATTALSKGGGGLDSAADLKRKLQGSGVLEFHIMAQANKNITPAELDDYSKRLEAEGPRVKAGDKFKWFEVDRPEELGKSFTVRLFNDRYYALASIEPADSLDARGPKWALTDASPGRDQTGQSIVEFQFDPTGGKLFGDLTSNHVHDPMAIMLDGRVISAPNINQPITGGRGQISGGGDGGFSQKELDYLVSMLKAGSLPAQLNSEPISERTVGPQLGEDNLRAGLLSCGLGLIVIAIFLIGYYHLSGVIAFLAVLLNIVLILGSMAAIGATFTLPGIAAIVLTIGTAVDANVLVFERLREEQHRGLPIRMALRNAYDRAFSAIIDSNMTTVITSVFLIIFGTEEVKGFGIVLIIGILASLFTALFVTRTAFGILVDRGHIRQLGSFPLSFPKWDRMLRPNFNWMGVAWMFYAFSAVVIVAGLGLFVHYAKAGQVLDIEFASGTAITFDIKQPARQEEVRGWLENMSKQHPDVLPSPSVQRVGETGTTWELTTPNAESRKVRDLVVSELGESHLKVLKAEQPSTFAGVGQPIDQVAQGEQTVLPLTADNLSPDAAAKWPGGVVPDDARAYSGGAALFLRDLKPPLSPKEIAARINRQVLQVQSGQQAVNLPQFVVVGPGGSAVGSVDKAVDSAIVLARDESLPYERDKAKWQENVVAPLWRVVNDAIARPAELQQVKTFDASVAGDTQRDALIALTLSVLAIMAYIWIRFGNLKYGTATVVALLHDVVFTFAGLGFAHLLANTWFGDVLKLEPFRINLTVVAGILTIMGYSMVDTIVVFDRIREIRGKFGHVNKQVINDAINQTLSRTLLTAGTTTVMVTIMYFLGGMGIHGFTFVLLVGILVGTYSSVAIASPILLLGHEGAREASGKRPVGRLQQA